MNGEVIKRIDKCSTRVEIPSAANYIDNYACFNGSLVELNLLNANISIIGKYSFSHCHNLKIIQFPSSLKEICQGAFSFCKELETITFPNDSQLHIIGSYAFYDCEKLNQFNFPPLLEIIGESAFYYCLKIRDIHLQKTKTKYIRSKAFGKYSNCTIYAPSTIKSIYINRNTLYMINEENVDFIMDKCVLL